MNSIKIDMAKRYTDRLKTVLKDSLISVFVFGSVARGDDTDKSDIDLMAIVNELPVADHLQKLGIIGRFDELKGHAEFHDISCAIVTKERYQTHLEMRMPREGVNPLKEAIVLYDTGFISGLKEQLESGSISLRDDAYLDYLRYGDIRRSYLMRSIENGNLEDAHSDAVASAAHYLRAYFLYEKGEMIVSKSRLDERIHGECADIAGVYDGILEGALDVEVVLDSLDGIRDWVTGCVFALKNVDEEG